MKTRNAMQLKALINNKAKAAGVSSQLMLQNYMLERLIDRISRSSWRDCIIVKGGMLIGSLIGVDRRTTKDLDATVRGFTLTHSKVAEVFGEICAIDAEATFPMSCCTRTIFAKRTSTPASGCSCALATIHWLFRSRSM